MWGLQRGGALALFSVGRGLELRLLSWPLMSATKLWLSVEELDAPCPPSQFLTSNRQVIDCSLSVRLQSVWLLRV